MNNWVLFEILVIAFMIVTYSLIKKQSENAEKLLSVGYTTVLRGIAILMVYLQHTMGGLGSRFFTPLGGGGVAIFLIISGFGLSESYKKKGLSQYWKKKFLHVFFPWILIFFIFQYDFTQLDIPTILGNITLIKPIPWYLQYQLLWYVIFYIIHRFDLIKRYEYLIYALAALCIFFFGGDLQAEQSITFILGIMISRHLSVIMAFPPQKMSILIILMAILAIFSLGIKQIPIIRESFDNKILFHFIQLCLKTSLALSVIFGLQYVKKILNNSFLSFTGKISYEIYLVHLWVVPVVLTYYPIKNSYIYIAIFLLLTYFISFLFNKLNTKWIMRL